MNYQNIDFLILKELNHQEFYNNNNQISKKILSIYDIYPSFDWNIYKELNPYLYIIGLRSEKEYVHNYLLEGRYKGRIYSISQKKKNSFHILLATIGKKSIFNILEMLKKQLSELDYLTIVFDGKNNINNYNEVVDFTNTFICNVTIIIEDENLGYWGHGIRNKHNDLKGDFIFHIDDDDILFDDSFSIIRKNCKDVNIIYIFKIMLENGSIVWKNKMIEYSKISTQSGIIPKSINKEGFWELKYGGDYDFYKNLSKKYNIIFIDKLIYRKIGNRKNKN